MACGIISVPYGCVDSRIQEAACAGLALQPRACFRTMYLTLAKLNRYRPDQLPVIRRARGFPEIAVALEAKPQCRGRAKCLGKTKRPFSSVP